MALFIFFMYRIIQMLPVNSGGQTIKVEIIALGHLKYISLTTVKHM